MQRHIVVLIISCLAGFLPSPRAQRPDFYDLSTLRTVELTFSQADWYQQLVANRTAKRYIKADLKVDGQVFKDIGIRFRGNSSYWGLPSSSKKRMFKISIDHFVPDRKLYGYKTLNFNNNYVDPTMVREVISYSVFRKFLPAPKSNYIKLRINAPGVTNPNWGPYINTEQVNKDMLRNWHSSRDGNRYRGERNSLGRNQSRTALTWQGTNPSAYSPYYELKNASASGPWTDIIAVCNHLNNSTIAQRPQVLPKVLDIDNALWFHASANVIVWLDSYIGRYVHNFYLYTDEFHRRMTALPWDTNSTFGGYTDGVPNVRTVSPWYRATDVNRPLFRNLVQVPKWRERYLSHIRTILADEFRWDVIGPRIAACQDLIRTEMQNDPHRLYSMQWFKDNVTKDITVGRSRRPGMKPFIDARRAYLLAHVDVKAAAPTLSNLMLNPAKPDPTQQAWVTAKISKGSRAATLYWRVKGP
ncbi:MAG: CotH kinase family protein, partial [Planctomycetota bacterium]|nr:CotH kinase family protein [Planctomycetota bacterium]